MKGRKSALPYQALLLAVKVHDLVIAEHMQSTLRWEHYSFAQRYALMGIDHCLLLEVGIKTSVSCAYTIWDFRQDLYITTSLFIYFTAISSTGCRAKCKVLGLDFKKC